MDGYGRFSVGSPSSLIAQGKNVVYSQSLEELEKTNLTFWVT